MHSLVFAHTFVCILPCLETQGVSIIQLFLLKMVDELPLLLLCITVGS